MVAYSFKRQFIEPILGARKSQTIRSERKRHARQGETLQLYIGMRTKQCRLIGTATCTAVSPITIDFSKNAIVIGGRPHCTTKRYLEIFARQDGFNDWAGMRAFWKANHGEMTRWTGVLIRWDSFTAGIPNR